MKDKRKQWEAANERMRIECINMRNRAITAFVLMGTFIAVIASV